MNPLAIALQGLGFEVPQIALQGFAVVAEVPQIGRWQPARRKTVQVNEDEELLLLLM